MWRPFLTRSLRSVFGGQRRAVPPGVADRIFSRAYTGCGPVAGGGGGDVASRSNRQQQQLSQRRHLYVVLREWCTMGYSLHKLNLDDALEEMNGGASEGNGNDMDGPPNLRRFPEPIFRIGSRRIGPAARIHALGSNIVITGAAYGSKGLTLVYDMDAAELEIGEELPDELNNWHYDAVAAGDKLHALQVPRYLWEAPPLDPLVSEYAMEGNQRWTWACDGRSPMPTFASGASYGPTAHALHPDGRTIFVSVEHFNQGHDTFSLDTESGEWTHRGNWRLPFHGQGHYDGDLEAWVGVALGSHDWAPCDHSYLVSCDVPALADGSTPRPAWKQCEQKLTFIEAPLTATGQAPVLVHTGHGRLCLVETASSLEQATPKGLSYSYSDMLRVTMFRPKYGKNGELVMAAAPRAARSYVVSSAASFHGPAFWM